AVIKLSLDQLPAVAKAKMPEVQPVFTHQLVDMLQEAMTQAKGREQAFKAIDPIYSAARPPTDAGPWVYRGEFYIKFAWDARGGGYAGTVTPEGWKLFRERLDEATKCFEKAWDLDPTDFRGPTAMLQVLLGGNGGK